MEIIKNHQFTPKWYHHVLLCVVFLCLPFLLSPRPSGVGFFELTAPFQRDFIGFILLLAFFYLNYYVLIPTLYFRKKYILYGVSLIIMLLSLIFVPTQLTGRNLIAQEINQEIAPNPQSPSTPPPNNNGFSPNSQEPLPLPPNSNGTPPDFQSNNANTLSNVLQEVRHNLLLFVIVILMSFVIKIRERLFLMREKEMASQLNYLRNQINPHFLFNTLNGVYAMAVTKNKNTAQAIAQLSGFMRYMYNDSESSKILLSDELEFLENYIELQKIRFGERVTVKNSWKNNDNNTLKIEPLLLISFIENAFKYGISSEENLEIKIECTTFDNQLHLYVENFVKKDSLNEKSTKIGLKNTIKRLNLLYPNKHQLKIEEYNDIFTVNLTIEL